MHRPHSCAALVALAACAGPGEPDHVQTIEIPIQSLDGYQVYSPEELDGDPRAGDPTYVFLDRGEDAVRLSGPHLTFGAEDPAAVVHTDGVTVTPYSRVDESGETHQGLTVTLNDRLSFDIAIDDFESEVTPLAQVDIAIEGSDADTSFVVLGNGADGVAHDVTIRAVLDGVDLGSPTEPITLEVRSAAPN